MAHRITAQFRSIILFVVFASLASTLFAQTYGGPDLPTASGVARRYEIIDRYERRFGELSLISRNLALVEQFDEQGRLIARSEAPARRSARPIGGYYEEGSVYVVNQTRFEYDESGRVSRIRRLSGTESVTELRYVEDPEDVPSLGEQIPHDTNASEVQYFDEAGRLRLRVDYHQPGRLDPAATTERERSRTILFYENDRLVRTDVYAQRTLIGRTTHEYESDPTSIKTAVYGRDGEITSVSVNVYDQMDRLQRSTFYDRNGSVVRQEERVYRADGSYVAVFGTGDQKAEIEYDADGRPVEDGAVDEPQDPDGDGGDPVTHSIPTVFSHTKDTVVVQFGETYIDARTVRYGMEIPTHDPGWRTIAESLSGFRPSTIGIEVWYPSGTTPPIDVELLLGALDGVRIDRDVASPAGSFELERIVESLIAQLPEPPDTYIPVRVKR